jgi:hypothetical protein
MVAGEQAHSASSMVFSPGLKSSFVNIIWAFDSPGSLETAALLRIHLSFDMMPGNGMNLQGRRQSLRNKEWQQD